MILTGHQLPPLTVAYVLLTPALAAEWLSKNEGNRREKFIKQAAYARDMKGGRWLLTGETFKFDKAGRLIDGQNRCRAVIASGVSIPALVVYDLEPGAQAAMDSGAPRSSRDALTFAGCTNEQTVAAIANVRNAWRSGLLQHCMSSLPSGGRLTNTETVAFAAGNEGVEDVAAAANSIYSRGLRLPRGAIGTALLELGSIDESDRDEFFARIVEVRTAGNGDPIAALIKRVNDERANRRRLLESTALFLLFRTWNTFRAGESLHKFQLGAPSRGRDPETGNRLPATWAAIPEPK